MPTGTYANPAPATARPSIALRASTKTGVATAFRRRARSRSRNSAQSVASTIALAPVDRVVRIGRDPELRELGLGVRSGSGVEPDHLRPELEEPAREGERRRLADVVGLRLERKPQDGHPRARELAHLVAKALDDGLHGLVVDPGDLGEHRERVAETLGEAFERGDVLREAVAPVAETSAQEGRTDPRVRPHDVGHGIDVGAHELADAGEGVGVGDLEREEGVGGVLGQLGGRDVGLDQADAAVEQRRVQAPHRVEPTRVVGPDQESVGLEGIVNAGPLAEELGVGHEVEPRVGTNALERRADAIGRPGRNRRLAHDDGAVVGVTRDVQRGAFDGREVGLAVGVRGRPDADHHDLGAGQGPP